MGCETFLAMTAAEIQGIGLLPEKIGWMACHFSPYGTGLSNLPRALPAGSLLILNDRIPIHGHDPERICFQLREVISRLGCMGLLLDFQRPDCPETTNLVRFLSGELGCPVAVSADYGKESSGPVLLPPLPHHVPLAEYIAPWQARELWLELALDGEIITLTEEGSAITPLSDIPGQGHKEDALHCHYHVEIKEDCAEFTLWRTKEDLTFLLEEAGTLGISTAVGLYQELT